jgi:hypothetical protein
MPSDPGDHPESVQFSARNGAATSLPVARRTLIPAAGGSFQTLITSSVGRSVGQVSTYNIDVPVGRNARVHPDCVRRRAARSGSRMNALIPAKAINDRLRRARAHRPRRVPPPVTNAQ